MKRILKWCRDLFFNNKDLHLVFVNEFPKIIKDKHVYIEGTLYNKDFWYAKFKCPCGCGDTLTLNLMEEDPPFWKLKNSKKFSLSPSIRRKTKCRSHFWIIDSKVEWCKN
jgi:hypothetical protein